MKRFIFLILVLATAGCATLGTMTETQRSSAVNAAETPVDSDPVFPSSQVQSTGPTVIIPVTGGLPVLGIPLGGNIFQPVTGGLPIIGISTSP